MNWTIILTLVAVIAFFAFDNSEAMVKCQEKHSYDTCFHSLNR